jgi:D-alanyl-D-alanine carboxypeptidase/D-alanyl-D-alanine-endopeptidase (penicillin-binding protein 4)
MKTEHRRRRAWSIAVIAMCLVWLAGCAGQNQVAPLGQDQQLAAQLDAVLNRRAESGAVYTARVIDLSDARELYARDIDKPFIPASNLKLFVSSAALDRFGPDHAFATYLKFDGKNLWLIGSGDPGAGDPRIAAARGEKPTTMFDRWAAALKSRGITSVPGNLYYYDAALDGQWTHPSWSRSFLVDWYAAPVSGLNFNDNCVDVKIRPTTPGEPVAWEVMPPVRRIRIINESVTGTDRHEPEITREQNASVFRLKGPATRPVELESKPVTDPGAFFADALRTHLESNGILIVGMTERATAPAELLSEGFGVVAVHETKLSDILWRVNKNSQNLFAEALCKLLGWTEFQGASWEAGAGAVNAFLKRSGIDASGVRVVDGSGLSRENRVTSRAITELLTVMNRHKYADGFRNSLAVAGRDGTIRSRMKDIEGRVLAKTGYIGGVRSLSGYVQTRAGKWLAFSIIYNNIPGDVKPYEALQDEACRVMVDWAG